MTVAFVSRLVLVCSLVCVACGQIAATAPVVDGGQAGGSAGNGGSGADAATGNGGSAGSAQAAGATTGGAGAGDTESICVFADPQLEAALQKALKLGEAPIPRSQAAALTTVYATGVASLAGIECLTKLQTLTAVDGTISDLSPVSALKDLRGVQLARNDIADLAPLSGLEALKKFGLISNHVTTLSGFTLPVLKGCSEIHLDRNPIDAAELADACARGWPVFWGGNDGAPGESCNLICLK